MSSANTQETEIKLYVPELTHIIQGLQSVGATQVKPRLFERNVRYENAEQTLTSQGIVVRLREDDRIRLTYKEPGTVADDIISRFEAEVEVSDFDLMEIILGKLGYRPYMVYEKYRTTYTLDEAEIVLDEMPYGNFVEIEAEAAHIQQVLSRLTLQQYRRFAYSYARLFDFVKHNLGLDFTDLTFENFEGISVPEHALLPPDHPENPLPFGEY